MPCLEEIENDAKKRARLLDSLSRSFPTSALSKALHMACDENVDPADPLGSSCFASIRLEKFNPKEEIDDDELTSLAWLQDANLLKNITPTSKCVSPQPKYDSSALTNISYDSLLHRKHKPPYSFSCLIFMAIEASPTKCLPVKGIYDWIVKSFPYFHTASTGWRNSVRHNLSLNKCFKKVERDYRLGLGKGSSWCIDPTHRPNLLQALRRTPYHPFQKLQMISCVNGTNQNTDKYSTNETNGIQGKVLSPALGTKINNTKDSLTECPSGGGNQPFMRQSAFADVGKIRERILQDLRSRNDSGDLVCTAYPNEDHVYSIPRLVLEEARAVLDVSVDEGLDSASDSEQMDDTESGSDADLGDESEKEYISRHKSYIKENFSCRKNKGAVNDELKKPKFFDSDENEEQKTLYFTSLALLELAAGKQPISMGNQLHEKVVEKNCESRENSERKQLPRVKSSSRSRRGRKVSVARKRTIKNSDELLNIAAKDGKRRRKQLLPINSSLWGKRRQLPEEEILQKKAFPKKMLPTTSKRSMVRRQRK